LNGAASSSATSSTNGIFTPSGPCFCINFPGIWSACNETAGIQGDPLAQILLPVFVQPAQRFFRTPRFGLPVSSRLVRGSLIFQPLPNLFAFGLRKLLNRTNNLLN